MIGYVIAFYVYGTLLCIF